MRGRARAVGRIASTVQRSSIMAAVVFAAAIHDRWTKRWLRVQMVWFFLVRRRIATAFSTRQEINCEFFCCGSVMSCRAGFLSVPILGCLSEKQEIRLNSSLCPTSACSASQRRLLVVGNTRRAHRVLRGCAES